MQKISFPDYSSMALYIYEKAKEGKYVYTALFYDDAKEILKELSLFEDTEFEFIELRDPDWAGYTREFYLILDPQMHISCEEAWLEANEYHDACYCRFGDDDVVALIDGDASSLILDAAGTYKCIIASADGVEKELYVHLTILETEPTPEPSPEPSEIADLATPEPAEGNQDDGGADATPAPTKSSWWGR